MTMARSEKRPAARLGRPDPRLARLALAVLLTLGSLLAVAGPVPAVAQAEPADTATAVPETALAYLSVDLDSDSDQWQQAEALLARVGVPDAFAALEQSMLEDAQMDMGEGFTEADLDALLGGEIAVVVTEAAVSKFMAMAMESGELGEMAPMATPVPGAGTGIAAVLAPGDPDAVWAYVERQFADMAQETGAQVEETTYQDVTILSVAGGGPAADVAAVHEDPFSAGAAAARVDDFVLAAAVPADLEPLIDAATGTTGSLADFAPMMDLRANLADESLVFAYLNGQALVAAVGPEFFETMQSMAPQTPFPGAYEFYSGTVFWADDPGFRVDSLAIPPADASLADYVPDNAEVTLDERVPADSLFFFGGTVPEGASTGAALSVAQAINQEFGAGPPAEMPDTFEEQFSPEYVEEQFAQAEQVLGFDLRADLFDQLVGESGAAVSIGNLMTAGPAGVSAIFAAGVADADTVAGSVQQVVSLIESSDEAPDVSTRTVDGGTVYVLSDPETPEIPPVEFGVVGDNLLAGLGAGIDNFVSGPASSLADDEQYQRVMATLPAENYQVTYINLAQIAPLVMMMTGAMMGEMGGMEVPDADPACAEFSTQAAAQETYDADPFANSNLDQDFDGEACEDFFAAAGAAASPAASPVATGGVEAIQAFASVAYEQDGMMGSSAILYIAE